MREFRTSGAVRIESKDQTHGFGFTGSMINRFLARWRRFSTSSVVKP
jgi:hypothetical protein